MVFKKLCFMAWSGTIFTFYTQKFKIKILFLIMKQQIYNFLLTFVLKIPKCISIFASARELY
jgi:hypothetical protein